MPTKLLEIYTTSMPVILAGVLNMVWCRLPFPEGVNRPMDGGRILKDGKRLLGENKTWKGFWGMVALTALCALLWGFACGASPLLAGHNYLYRNYPNTPLYSGVTGIILGLAYVLCELPNSFVKRRISIPPGKTIGGFGGMLFILADQVDSALGCIFAVSLVYPMGVGLFLEYLVVWAGTHLVINLLLYSFKLRKNKF